jgi:uroporphyrinogen-III synthase
MARVLVMRPEPEAAATARRLEAAGHEAILAPLQRIAREPGRPPDGPFDALAVTSAHALPDDRGWIDAHRAILLHAVGPRTAAAARAAGFRAVEQGPGDAAGLAARLVAAVPRPARVLYLAGAVRRPDLEAALAAAGIGVRTHVAYRTEPAPDATSILVRALARAPDAALHYSPASARLYASLIAEAEIDAGLIHVCLSAAVAEALGGTARETARVAVRPDEDALLDALLDLTAAAGRPGVANRRRSTGVHPGVIVAPQAGTAGPEGATGRSGTDEEGSADRHGPDP